MSVSKDNNDRNQLLGEEKRTSYWQESNDDDDDEPLVDIRPTSSGSREPTVDDLRKQQTKILENQNEGLEALSKVISRQKSLAIRIGDEFEEQNGQFKKFTNHIFVLRNFSILFYEKKSVNENLFIWIVAHFQISLITSQLPWITQIQD